MIKVLLVDDEFLVCSFLKQLINWEEHGFYIAGQASNGSEAIEKTYELSPELIILDIGMPEMDGITFINWLINERIEVKVIVLSSHSDYRYVRETMKLGAVDYLLKHELTSENLLRVLKGLDFGIEKKTSGEIRYDSESIHLLRDSRVRGFLEGRLDTLPESLKRLLTPMPVSVMLRLSILRAEGDQGLQQESRLINRMLNTCVELASRNQEAKVVFLGDSRLLFLYSAMPGESEEEQKLRVHQNMSIIRDALLKYHNTYIDWKSGDRCMDLSRLPAVYNRLLETSEKTAQTVNASSLSIEHERRLITSVLSKDRKGVLLLLHEVFGSPEKQAVPEILTGDLLALIVKLYQENGIPFAGNENHEIIRNNPDEIRQYYTDSLIQLIDAIDSKERYSKPILEVIDFVDKHYKEDFGVPDLGSHINMNSSYLSTLFKKETGMGLSQYINRVRIYAAAKLIIMENVPPTKVYELVGFRNYTNFFNTFKDITGYAPKAFRHHATTEWIVSFHPLKPGAAFPLK